jgi:hypothetical protein
MSSVRFEPIAVQLSKQVHLDVLLPRDVIEQLRQRLFPRRGPALDSDTEQALLQCRAVLAAAIQLLGAPQFERAGRWYDRLRDEFTPGGPPQSPVYDSYATQHVLADVPHGLAGETPCSALAWLTRHDAARERLHQAARALADSQQDVYRVLRSEGTRAELERLRDRKALTVRQTDEFLRGGDLVLARVLSFGVGHFIVEPPYLLRASDRDWLEYFQRIAPDEASPPSATHHRSPGQHAKLTPKQRARLRQKKAAQRDQGSEAALLRHLKTGNSERYWFEYIVDAYAGERRGVVYLAGVPDRPETLPHHDAFDPATAAPQDPMQRLRDSLLNVAEREGILDSSERALRISCEDRGIEFSDLPDSDQPLFTAYCTLGARSARGLTALEQLERDQSLDEEQRALLDSLKSGWFGALRVDALEADAFEALDTLQGKPLRISRPPRLQLTVGDLVLGWVYQVPDGSLQLEGGLLHIPKLLSAAVSSLIQDARKAIPPAPEADWKLQAAELPLLILLGLTIVRRRKPLQLVRDTSRAPD